METFSTVTAEVNEDFALGAALRDRCAETGDVDDCLAWRTYRESEEARNPGLNYEAALERWERLGPY